MLIRIVRMTFREDEAATFLETFHASKKYIRSFPGCDHLELLQDVQQKNIYYTYSFWKSEEDLNNYRHSNLFKEIWSKTKILFAEKPQAHSLYKLETV